MKRLGFIVGILLWALGQQAHAADPWINKPKALENVGFEQKLGAQLPLDTPFRDEQGKQVTLRSYFGQRPVVLSFVYFDCPMLCTEVLNGMVRSLRAISLKLGKDYDIVTVSFDAREKPALAAAKKKVYLERYDRKADPRGWAFLTGDAPAIRKLTDAAGFHFSYDPDLDQFAHASGIMIVTPSGKISHYFYGVEYSPKDMRLALVEASDGNIGSPVDQLLLYCFHYDPATGKYGLVIMRVMRLCGAATALSLMLFVWLMLRQEKRLRHDPNKHHSAKA